MWLSCAVVGKDTTTAGPTEEDLMANEAGTTLTCDNEDCGCRLRIESPCPHGDSYTCACGHPLVDADAKTG